jgi:hypothetical protein
MKHKEKQKVNFILKITNINCDLKAVHHLLCINNKMHFVFTCCLPHVQAFSASVTNILFPHLLNGTPKIHVALWFATQRHTKLKINSSFINAGSTKLTMGFNKQFGVGYTQ